MWSPSKPLQLTDSELTAVMNALAHWRVVNRDRFLQQVAQVLSGMPKEMLGDGAVHQNEPSGKSMQRFLLRASPIRGATSP
jgi:hypothetical protein